MKGIYIYSSIEFKEGESGEYKKAVMQVQSFNELGFDTELCANFIGSKNCKFKIRLPFYPIYLNEFSQNILKNIDDVDFLYVRRHIIDNSLIKLFKKAKIKNSKIKIIMEIPSYPYFQEINRIIDLPLKIKELLYTKYLVRYVDKIVTYTTDVEIFNIKTISIANGIKLNSIVPNDSKEINKESFILLGVALVSYWHGYDRIINGLSEYYRKEELNKKRVVFYIVGSGSELNNLKKLVCELNLDEYVIFKGPKFGIDLDEIYNMSDIAIGCLGVHRKGIKQASSLKLREYCAKGLPFIKSEIDLSFDEKNFKYMMTVQANDDAIDIKSILNFNRDLMAVESKEEIIRNMREFASENLDWNIQMKKVINEILKE